MSKSYRDKERLESKKAQKEIAESLTSLTSDDLNQKYLNAKSTKEVKRYGNNRKMYSKLKVQERRIQRKKDNNLNDC